MSRPSRSLALVSRLAAALPASWDDPLAAVAAAVSVLAVPRRRAHAAANAAALFPGADARSLARRAERSYARFLLEYLRDVGRSTGDDAARNPWTIGPGIEEALAQGRGLVMCTAHVGNWEMGARALARLGRPITIVAEPQYAPSWRSAVHEAKRRGGMAVVAPDVPARALVRSLEQGGVIGLLVDGAGYAHGRVTRLAGHRVALPTGPARLAALSGAVLAGGTCFRTAPDRFQSELHALGGTERAPVEDVDALHAAVARWLEELLLAHPGEWCIFRPFFDDARQAGERRAA
jgi:KDO2-lipid IV(A) lauroyltransferase